MVHKSGDLYSEEHCFQFANTFCCVKLGKPEAEKKWDKTGADEKVRESREDNDNDNDDDNVNVNDNNDYK